MIIGKATEEASADGEVARGGRPRGWLLHTLRRFRRLPDRWAWLGIARSTLRSALSNRFTGLAAEMSFFALLGLVPLTVAFGATLGLLWQFSDETTVLAARGLVIDMLRIVLGGELARDLVPFVRELLRSREGGVALGGLAVSLLIGSRIFTPVIFGLDCAHGVSDRRSLVVQRLLGVALGLGSFAVTGLMVAVLVLGPLLGSARLLATRLAFGRAFELSWAIGRWPLMLLFLAGFLASVYRFGPSVSLSWRDVLPGTVATAVLWLTVAAGFRVYLSMSGRTDVPVTGSAAEQQAVEIVGHAVGAVIATALWVFLLSGALLLGGELNAVLLRRREKAG